MSFVVSEWIEAVESALICEAESDEMIDIDAQAFSFACSASKGNASAAPPSGCGLGGRRNASRSLHPRQLLMRHGSSGPLRQRSFMLSGAD